jgi:hypothetical protein
MIAYAFKFLDDDGVPTDFFGIAIAKNMADMFIKLDEHGDPYNCIVKPITSASICFNTEVVPSDSFENETQTLPVFDESTELDERTYFLFEGDEAIKGWKHFNWTEYEKG